MENENLTNDINNTPTDSEKKVDVLRIVSITVNTIFYIFIFLLLLFSITQITGSKKNKIKSIFGIGYESVVTDSMYVRDRGLAVGYENRMKNTKTSFDAGDLVWVTKINNKEAKKLKKGDIVTFVDVVSNSPSGESGGFLNTHRIVDFVYDDSGKKQSAVLQGDMFRGSNHEYKYVVENESVMNSQYHTTDIASIRLQMQSEQYIQIVALEDIEAKYIGHWKNGGDFVNWLSNPKKGFIVIILISGAFLIFEMFMVIKNIMLLKTEKLTQKTEEEKEALKDEMKKSLLDEERERIRAELMKELAEKNKEDNSKNEEDEKDNETEDENSSDEQ